jgi:hypothetical protein
LPNSLKTAAIKANDPQMYTKQLNIQKKEIFQRIQKVFINMKTEYTVGMVINDLFDKDVNEIHDSIDSHKKMFLGIIDKIDTIIKNMEHYQHVYEGILTLTFNTNTALPPIPSITPSKNIIPPPQIIPIQPLGAIPPNPAPQEAYPESFLLYDNTRMNIYNTYNQPPYTDYTRTYITIHQTDLIKCIIENTHVMIYYLYNIKRIIRNVRNNINTVSPDNIIEYTEFIFKTKQCIYELLLGLYKLHEKHIASIKSEFKRKTITDLIDPDVICTQVTYTKDRDLRAASGIRLMEEGDSVTIINDRMVYNEKQNKLYYIQYLFDYTTSSPQSVRNGNRTLRDPHYRHNYTYFIKRSAGNNRRVFIAYHGRYVWKMKGSIDKTLSYIQTDNQKQLKNMFTEVINMRNTLNHIIMNFNIINGIKYSKHVIVPPTPPIPPNYNYANFIVRDIDTNDDFDTYMSVIYMYNDYKTALYTVNNNEYYMTNTPSRPTIGQIIYNSVENTKVGTETIERKDAMSFQPNDNLLKKNYVLDYYIKYIKLNHIYNNVNNIVNHIITSDIRNRIEIHISPLNLLAILEPIIVENINTIINSVLDTILRNTVINKLDNPASPRNYTEKIFNKTIRDNKSSIIDSIFEQLNKEIKPINISNQGLQFLMDPFGPPTSDKDDTRLIPFDKLDICNIDDKCFKKSDTIIPLLIKYGANPNSVESSGETPLSLSIYLQNIDILKTLLSFGSNVIFKINNVIKNVYEMCLYQVCTIMDNSPSMSLEDIDERVKKELVKQGDIKEQFYYSKYILKMAMYLFNHQLTQHAGNYPYMWTYNEHMSLMELLDIENKNIELPFGKVNNKFKIMLDNNAFVKNKLVEKYNVKIHKYTELYQRFKNAETNLNLEPGDFIALNIQKLQENMKRVKQRIVQYTKLKTDIAPVAYYSNPSDNVKIKSAYERYESTYKNSICNYYNNFFNAISNGDIGYKKNVSEYSLYIQAWENILDRHEVEVKDYTQLVPILNRYITEHESMTHDIFVEIYSPVVNFYDKVLDKYGRDYFELSEYYNTNKYMKQYYDGNFEYSYGHNYALSQIMCIMVHVVKHTLCLDFVRVVSNKLLRALINKGKTDVITMLHDKLKDFYEEVFKYVPEKMVKVVCNIYESDDDPDKKLTEKEILNNVFEHINRDGGEITIEQEDYDKIRGEVIKQFEIYMRLYILEIHKSFVLQLKSFSVQAKLLKITMLLGEKAVAEMKTHHMLNKF